MLSVEERGPVVVLTLNRPDKCNALSVDLNLALVQACKSISPNASIVVLRGNGKHFCAGSDLADLYQADRTAAERVIRMETDACQALAALPQLTVAILHGKCLGGGAILPLYCDLRIAHAGVAFAMPEVPLGWIPPYGIERLLANVPRSFALDMLLTGRICGDQEALDRGWIHRLLAAEEDPFAYIDKLAGIPRQTLLDTCIATTNKNHTAMKDADEQALIAFLDHFDTDHARSTIHSFMARRRK